MSVPVRTEAGTAVSCNPIWRDHGTNAHTLRIVSEPPCPGWHDAPVQRSLPLFRVIPFRDLATCTHCDSQRVDAQQAPSREQPSAVAVDRDARIAAEPAATPSLRRQLWSPASVGLLRAEYPTAKLVRDISAELGRSVGAVYGKARRLNLKRPRRGAAPPEGGALLPAPALVPQVPQPSVAPAPEPPPMPPAPQPVLPIPQPSPAPQAERTKMGGRPGCWTKDDGALSERLERLFIANFSPGCIAAVLGVTERAAATRAWVVNCPRRDPQAAAPRRRGCSPG